MRLMRSGLSIFPMLCAFMGAVSMHAAWAQDDVPAKPLEPAHVQSVLATGGGSFKTQGLHLMLLPDGRYLLALGVSQGFGADMNGTLVGQWTRQGKTSNVCLREATVGPILLVSAGSPPGGTPKLYFSPEEMADSVFALGVDPVFDGRKLVEEVRSGRKGAWAGAEGHAEAVEVGSGFRFVDLAGPGVRQGAGFRYRAYRFELPGYPVQAYQIVQDGRPNSLVQQLFEADGCLSLTRADWKWSEARALTVAERRRTGNLVAHQLRDIQRAAEGPGSRKLSLRAIARIELPSFVVPAPLPATGPAENASL